MILNSVRLKKVKKHMNSILKDNLDRLKNPSIHGSFQATVAGIFAALFMLHGEILRKKKAGQLNHGSPTRSWICVTKEEM